MKEKIKRETVVEMVKLKGRGRLRGKEIRKDLGRKWEFEPIADKARGR